MAIDLLDDRTLEQRPSLREACIKLSDMAATLGPEAKLPTMLELHGQLGLSVKTISRAVRELERRNVLRSINGVGIYVASDEKRVLTGNIGFMTTNDLAMIQDMSYWALVLAGIRTEAARRERHLLLIDNVETFDRWEKIDGVIISNMVEKMYPTPVLAKPPKSVPCIALINKVPDVVSVTADDFQGVYALTRHLISLGHRRIAFIAAFDSGLAMLEQRRKGYLAALKDASIECEAGWMRDLYLHDAYLSGNFMERSQGNVRRWIAEDWDAIECTALIAQNDAAALGAIAAFEESGRSVPGDVSVVGFDGVPGPHGQTQLLTTAQVPLFEIGRTSATMLFDWLDNPARIPWDQSLAVELMRGQSSGPPA